MSPTPFRLPGVISLLLTPFSDDRTIDWPTYQAYVDWQLAQDPAGLFAVCGSSEMKWLESEERLQLAAQAVKQADDCPVLATANLGPNIEAHPDELARMAETGITAAVLIPPSQVSGDPARYRDYLFGMAESAPCPLVLYEWPQVDNHLMDPALFGDLAQAGVVAGIKDTTCTIEGVQAKQSLAGQAVVYQANTPYLLEALEMGCQGIMAITSTCEADLVVKLWTQFQANQIEASQTHRELVTLDALLRLAYPVTAKYLVSLQGVKMPLKTRWPVNFVPEMAKALEVWQTHLSNSPLPSTIKPST